jgi:hypothetical protein
MIPFSMLFLFNIQSGFKAREVVQTALPATDGCDELLTRAL